MKVTSRHSPLFAALASVFALSLTACTDSGKRSEDRSRTDASSSSGGSMGTSQQPGTVSSPSVQGGSMSGSDSSMYDNGSGTPSDSAGRPGVVGSGSQTSDDSTTGSSGSSMGSGSSNGETSQSGTGGR